jgi:hypothetical protein
MVERSDCTIAGSGTQCHIPANLARPDDRKVLVDHSFSGMIVTEVGMHPNVSALVWSNDRNGRYLQARLTHERLWRELRCSDEYKKKTP